MQTISNKDIEIQNLSNKNNELTDEMKILTNSIVKLNDSHNSTLKQVISNKDLKIQKIYIQNTAQ